MNERHLISAGAGKSRNRVNASSRAKYAMAIIMTQLGLATNMGRPPVPLWRHQC